VTVRFYVGATFVGQTVTQVCGHAAVIGCWSASTDKIHIPVELGGRPICAYGIDPDGIENGLLGCTFPYPSTQTRWGPIGSLDLAAVAPGLLQLKGWAGDIDGDRTTKLRVYVDGRLVVQRTADQPRPDVQRAFFAVGPTTGFNFTLPARPGPHQICVFSQNTGWSTAGNSTVGCVTRTVPGVQQPGAHDPRGAIDSLRTSPTSMAGFFQFLSRGWAFDPDTGAPITVLFRTLTEDAFVPVEARAGTATLVASKPRPSVAATVPGAGPNTGFDGPVLTTRFEGPSLVCAYGVNVGPGASRLLGCR
jgi:hypothetical protein